MTREEARQAAEVMMAYADGREIEYYDNIHECWESDDYLCFNWYNTKYRVKPEPKYRPFNNAEECWNEMLKHQPFGWLKNKERESAVLIGNVYTDNEVMIVCATNERNSYSATKVFTYYVFADGTPFGVKED